MGEGCRRTAGESSDNWRRCNIQGLKRSLFLEGRVGQGNTVEKKKKKSSKQKGPDPKAFTILLLTFQVHTDGIVQLQSKYSGIYFKRQHFISSARKTPTCFEPVTPPLNQPKTQLSLDKRKRLSAPVFTILKNRNNLLCLVVAHQLCGNIFRY